MLFWNTGILSGSLANWNTICALIGAFAFFAPIFGFTDNSNGNCRALAVWWAGSAVIALLGVVGIALLVLVLTAYVLWKRQSK